MFFANVLWRPCVVLTMCRRRASLEADARPSPRESARRRADSRIRGPGPADPGGPPCGPGERSCGWSSASGASADVAMATVQTPNRVLGEGRTFPPRYPPKYFQPADQRQRHTSQPCMSTLSRNSQYKVSTASSAVVRIIKPIFNTFTFAKRFFALSLLCKAREC